MTLSGANLRLFQAMLRYGVSPKKEILYLVVTAALSEIPYNLVTGGKLLDFSTRNPAFAMVIAMLVLYFFRRYEEKGKQNTLARVIVTVAAALWCMMLSVEHGLRFYWLPW